MSGQKFERSADALGDPPLLSDAGMRRIECGVLEASAEVGALSATAAAMSVVVSNAATHGLGLTDLVVMLVRLWQLLPDELAERGGPEALQ